MSPASPWPNEPFRTWLRRESGRALKWSAAFLLIGIAGVFLFRAIWPNGYWTRLNRQLTHTALNQHPVALVRIFAARLGGSEYGSRPLALAAPFNITEAADELKRDYPEFFGVADGKAVTPRAAALRRQNPERFDQRSTAYVKRYQQIQAARFEHLYGKTDLYSPPDETAALGQIVTKIVGLPDAFLHTVRSIIVAGTASILLFSTLLALSAAALGSSHRPARKILKIFLWPGLASALAWLAIFVMAASAAIFGAFTPNTSALALFVSLPFLFLAAKIPLRLAEGLVFQPPPPKPWDGIERRKNRAPAPPSDVVPPGGSDI